VTAVCGLAGVTRQGYYQAKRERTRREIDEEALVELVLRERNVQPHLGARKVLVWIAKDLEAMDIQIGRDAFFDLLRERGLLLARRWRRGERTTDSRHGWRVYPNLYREMVLTGPHQAWLSDLTYLRTLEGFLYLSLLHDAFSRKVVGYALTESLEATGPLAALAMALGQLPCGAKVVHHSDRGVQYACGEYIRRLEARGLRVSMTQENHCYENAQAERLNGIFKQEYGLGETFATKRPVGRLVGQAIWLYNTRRPHTSLQYRTPESVHAQAA
jgi:putative transposase